MRMIDADELKLELKWLEIDKPVYHDVMSTIDEIATVDAVEVVRCKDCKHNYYNMIPSGEAEYECAKWVELPITADFYCAWGEREDETN